MVYRIRVAIIGLSSSAKTAWASRAHLPYLFSSRGRSKYEVVALLNSSAEAARAAAAAYGLPLETTRTYGDPAELAADDGVDLVVCTTRVDKHYATVLDSVRRGKDVFVEWPLAQDGRHARELADEASKAGIRTIVGLQGVKAPVVAKLREVLESGRIGKVLSSELRVFGGLNDRHGVPQSLSYFTQREVGGNVYTIGFAHSELSRDCDSEGMREGTLINATQFLIWFWPSLASSPRLRATSTCSGRRLSSLTELTMPWGSPSPPCPT
ncbi:hypothetical protein VTG60DRAFT_3852 [Thermothelomyces hinnuleus]